MSINSLVNNPTIMAELAAALPTPAVTSQVDMYAFNGQLVGTANTLTLQNQTVAVTAGKPMIIALSFSYGGLAAPGTGTSTISVAVNGGTPVTLTVPVVSNVSSSTVDSQTMYCSLTSLTNSANIIATVSSGAALTGGGGTTNLIVIAPKV